MSDGNRQCRGGERLEIELNQSARNMEGAVEQLIRQAESDVNSCQVAEARKGLDIALQKSASIWSLAGGSCQPWRQASG